MSKDEVDSQRDRAGGLGIRQIPREMPQAIKHNMDYSAVKMFSLN